MRLKVLILIIIGLLTLITAFVGVKQPALHKQTMFSDEYHRFVEEEIPTSDISITQVQNAPAQTIKTDIQKNKQQPAQKQVTKTIQTPVKQAPQKVTTPVKPTTTKPVETTNKVVEQQKPQQTVQKPHELTEQEEIIAWNKWRSNLQNQVMKDAPMRAPLGTVFKFSFTVDKYGNLSNIKVWSENPNYTDLAVRVIKPVLTSYTHKPILNFPQGTKRVITNVTGGYKISTTTKYSSPSDYSDYEKVKRYN